MKYTLKHRLVGAAVLTAIAVIMLPGFFKERKEFKVNTKSQIPAAPQLQAETYANPQPVPDIQPAPPPETMFVPQESVDSGAQSSLAASSAAASQLGKSSASSSSLVGSMPLNAQGLPEAWVVQVGSFTTKEAANKLRDELQADNIKAYVRTTPNGGSSISRVYVGPKLDKTQALQIKEQMDKRLKVKSMVMKFQP